MLSIYIISFVLILYGNTVQTFTALQDPTTLKNLLLTVDDISQTLEVRSKKQSSLFKQLFMKFDVSVYPSLGQGISIELDPPKRTPSNCAEALMETQQSGIYTLKVRNYGPSFPVYCDANTFGGNWTVIQRRQDGSENFYRNWTDYKNGFGSLTGEFFIGLDKLYALTAESPQELLIELEDFQNEVRYARYNEFAITAEDEDYTMNRLGSYTGNAGDSLTYHKKMKFTTKDRDNDLREDLNCANYGQGAWWYKNCFQSNLNGPYVNNGSEGWRIGITWYHWKVDFYSLKSVKMLIRPTYY